MKTQAIVPTAGLGTRLKTQTPKPLVDIDGKPIIAYTLEAIEHSQLIDSIILVGHEEYLSELEKIVKQYQLAKVNKIVAGGQTRKTSVYHGLNILDKDTQIVLIHDGVRPLVRTETIDQAIQLAQKEKAVVVAVPVKPTIKKIKLPEMTVKETLDRSTLWEIQTPQVFHKEVIVQAHAGINQDDATDDSMLVEAKGITVKVLQGDYSNIKVTTPEDLCIARALLRERKSQESAAAAYRSSPALKKV